MALLSSSIEGLPKGGLSGMVTWRQRLETRRLEPLSSSLGATAVAVVVVVMMHRDGGGHVLKVVVVFVRGGRRSVYAHWPLSSSVVVGTRSSKKKLLVN
jgi:hypothetical protein